jgi:hypothetical protein
MFTLFSIPKAFTGHIGVIQRNAIKSWTLLEPKPEIILFGQDEGTAAVARDLGLRHIPDVAANEFGTPLLDDLFHKAEAAAQFSTLGYVNADIILLGEFPRAVELVQRRFPKSLMVSKRINLEVSAPLDFCTAWEQAIKLRANTAGVEGHYSSIDAFVFLRGMYPAIPQFAIGRLWFDHWLIKAARTQGLPVVDISLVSSLIHQQHDYSHVPGGADQVWRGEEAERNFQLYGGIKHAYTLLDVTHELTAAGSLRRVYFRKSTHYLRTLAWDLFVRRSVNFRNALRLRRKFWQKPSAAGRG